MSSQQKLHPSLMMGMQNVSSGVLSPSNSPVSIMDLLGLRYNRPFHQDSVFLLLITLGPIAWFSMREFLVFQPPAWQAIWSAAFLSVMLWQPLFEELLFRGTLQGYALQSMRMQNTWNGFTLANVFTSLLFSLAHLASHSMSWSLLVFIPSLCFGFVRDRFGSVYPAIALHAFYNAGYFLIFGDSIFQNSR